MWARKWENNTMEIQGPAVKLSGPGIFAIPSEGMDTLLPGCSYHKET